MCLDGNITYECNRFTLEIFGFVHIFLLKLSFSEKKIIAFSEHQQIFSLTFKSWGFKIEE